MIAQIHQSNRLYSKGYSFFLRANSIPEAVECLKEVIKYAYDSERDLFPARLCFEVLIRNHKDGSGVKMVEEIQTKHFTEKTPLFNLMSMIVDSIKVKDFDLFKFFINNYKA